MIGGKLGSVVQTPVPVRFADDAASQALRSAVRAPHGYAEQVLHRGLLLRCSQIISAKKNFKQ